MTHMPQDNQQTSQPGASNAKRTAHSSGNNAPQAAKPAASPAQPPEKPASPASHPAQQSAKPTPPARPAGQPQRRPSPSQEPEGYRLKLPRRDRGELFGIVEELFGSSRMKVRSEDGKTRMCRVRGKMRRRFWIKRNDIVIIHPWTDFQSDDTKADIVWRYTDTQSQKLRRRGLLSRLEKREETEIVI